MSYVSAGWEFSLAWNNEKEILTSWGNNKHGQLGRQKTSLSWSPSPVELQLQRASCDIKCGWSHVLVLDTNGDVWSWGKGTEGQLGRGTFTSSNVPSRIETLSQVKHIACGSSHSLCGKLYNMIHSLR